MDSNTDVELKSEVEYIFAFISDDGEVLPHFAYTKYITASAAKQDAENVINMLPEPIRKASPTYICEVTRTYKIIESV